MADDGSRREGFGIKAAAADDKYLLTIYIASGTKYCLKPAFLLNPYNNS
jgi:hypothetical protein